ncbi:probable E3 ubiquitin protein ligase DRIPH isoform X2 [Capsella rubella]|uniref:probable E3 ubiquitin protein ligase DRIPH isoform X2 n=1 Tax=Capsella rubella TaxID=81985 RepID=UPI000CD572F1|nr:probable E3 ubiquitin protein ligase DRIPH isoform X2 [Capsella rubella]
MPSVQRLKKTEVAKCLTCPLCHNLFEVATTINECLHTFCWKCIHSNFTAQNLPACPVCDTHLGSYPDEKLRVDHHKNAMKEKLFPSKKKGVKAGPETVAASSESCEMKETPLTSLMDSSSGVPSSSAAPLVPTTVVLALPAASARPYRAIKKRYKKTIALKKNDTGKESEQPPPKETTVKKVYLFDLNKEPDEELDEAESSRSHDSGTIQGLSDLSPLDINSTPMIVEPGVASNGLDSIQNNCVVNREANEVPVQVNENTILISSDRGTEEVSGQKLKNNGKGKQECASSSRPSRNRRGDNKGMVPNNSYALRPRKDGRAATPAASSTPEALVSVETIGEVVEGPNNNGVWFKLVPLRIRNSEMLVLDNKVQEMLKRDEKIRYVEAKDGNVTVSQVKKFLMKKVGFQTEDEVEIWLGDEPVCSSQTLCYLLNWFIQITPVPEGPVMVGDSAVDYLMPLHYSYKSGSGSASGSGSGSASGSGSGSGSASASGSGSGSG